MIYLQLDDLYLREFEVEDKELLFSLDSDPKVMRYLTDGKTSSKAEIDKIADVFTKWRKAHEGKYGYWMAFDIESDEFIGWFHLRPLKENLHDFSRLEIGYRICQKYWGKGITTKVSKRLIKEAFEELSAIEVWAITMKENVGSQRVMQKCGMLLDREDLFLEYKGENQKCVWYVLGKDEYEES